ncbi:DUF4125 family protein [Oleidesulfovibrio sp.]|uniref:DUF4125 family protein n=1 Tax=Oleidesulfovibrio sp. TaxID=2909707 RepID=UPI003A884052
MNTSNNSLLESVIVLELAMFLEVNNRGGISPCQERPESFRIMREITHAVLSVDFLQSYLNDLTQARRHGRNLMTEKYALMEGLIPQLSNAPAIQDIVQAESAWRKEVAAQFPHAVHPDGHHSFCLYLSCELQTYSPATLAAYAACVTTARYEQRNLTRQRYELLMQKLGYGSLEQCEQQLATTKQNDRAGIRNA